MLSKVLMTIAMAVFVAGRASGQEPHQIDPAQNSPGAGVQAAAPQAPAPQPAPRAMPDPANIRLELTITITDQRGAALLPAKVASIHVIDRENGRIRMGRTANSAPSTTDMVSQPSPVLNVDAMPTVMPGGRVRVSLSFEYRPGGPEADKLEPIHINERLSAIVDDGKPVVVSQTTDPASDRHVKVELKATIVK